MREHMGLFHGKRTDTGDWVEGCLLQIGEARKFDPNVPFSNCYIVPKTDADVVMWINNDGTIALDIEAYHVDPTTIGECTSLKDKNGKLIFEHQKFKYEGELYEVRIVCGECRLYDKFDHYCELYKYAGSGEIVSED